MDSGPFSGDWERENGKTGFHSGLQQLLDLSAGVKDRFETGVPNLRPPALAKAIDFAQRFPAVSPEDG